MENENENDHEILEMEVTEEDRQLLTEVVPGRAVIHEDGSVDQSPPKIVVSAQAPAAFRNAWQNSAPEAIAERRRKREREEEESRERWRQRRLVVDRPEVEPLPASNRIVVDRPEDPVQVPTPEAKRVSPLPGCSFWEAKTVEKSKETKTTRKRIEAPVSRRQERFAEVLSKWQ